MRFFSMLKNFKNRSLKPPMSVLFPAVEHWFQGEQGQLLLAAQERQLEHALADCFGYHLVQLSVSRKKKLYESARIQHKISCYPLLGEKVNGSYEIDVCSTFEQLPFATGSVDTVILHHSFEFVENPQQLLREVERITVNGGHIILLGFNPYSLMGVQSLITRYLPRSIWHNKSLSHHRMSDWLSLLGFQVTQQYFGYHHLESYALNSSRAVFKRCLALVKNLPFGSFYCLTAIKQTAAMTPDTKRWLKTTSGFSALTPKTNIRHGKVVPMKRD